MLTPEHVAQIRQRIADLQQARATAVQQAMQQAALPYDSALGELQWLLTLSETQPPDTDKETPP
jgi:hypothetical protein